MFSTAAVAQGSIPQTSAQQAIPVPDEPALSKDLPPIPRGKSTLIGGTIHDVDPVRDQFKLKAYGGKALTVLYDERTQVFRDSDRISIMKLQPDEHTSVETILDGDKVFALRIRVSSKAPAGDSKGQLMSYNPVTGLLVLNTMSTRQPLTLRVPANAKVIRVGQLAAVSERASTSDLVPDALLEVKFNAQKGTGVVSEIDLIAIPGADFAFSGTLSNLDLNAGRLVISGAENSGTQEIIFDPLRFPESRQLHEGMKLRVDTKFDGNRYVANQIKVQ